MFKNALAVLIVYRIAEASGLNGQVLVTVAAGLFILPFFLFSATAGQIADKFEKTALIKKLKAIEIVVMALAAIGFLWGDVPFLIGVLFLMGTQSAFFGPLKYSVLPEHLSENELIGANALVEAGTFLAILFGTPAGGLLILKDQGTAVISIGVIAVAITGWFGSQFLPKTPLVPSSIRINPNFLGETWTILRHARQNREVFLSILGISWFWLVGATFLAQFPAFAKDVLSADETVVTLFLTLFSIGIGVGALLCNKLLNGEISGKYVPLGAIGMALFTADLFLASPSGTGTTALLGASAFLAEPANWRIVVDLLGISLSGGIYIVPLYALLQSKSEKTHRARVIAANNIMNALFVVVGAVIATAMLAARIPVPEVFLTLAVMNGAVAIYVCRLLPDAIVKALFSGLFKLFYRVEVHGMENYAKAGKRAVIVCNHVSFLDAVLLAAFLPSKPVFAINTYTAQRWWAKPFLCLVEAYPIDPMSPLATRTLIKAVRDDRHCLIFPEGRVTVTGSLMKVYEGPGMIADKADAMLVPVRVNGAEYTPFSRMKGKTRIRLFPKITITIMPPRPIDVPATLTGRARRQAVGRELYDVMSELIFETCDTRRSLFKALVDTASVHGAKQPALEDTERKPLSYGRLILGALVLGRKLAKLTRKGENTGFMLPNSVGAAVTFFALQAFGRVPAMLNFTSGAKNILAAVSAAQIKTVLTSRRFVQLAKLDKEVKALTTQVTVIYLEDIKEQISILDKIIGLITRPFADAVHARLGIKPNDPAVVLFTSGSEGAPKGVVLSHVNLVANRYQLEARVDFNASDIVFNALPIFHSFGLTGGMLLPVLSGIKTFLYPSPLHYRIVPTLVYDTNATIMFGTDTFLTGYARVAHPYDFYSIRYVFAGAEKVRDETRQVWAEKFGIRVMEGYGATETSPVLCVNTPMHYRAGTVGRFMPGIRYTLEPVKGIDEGGKLVVWGPNIMLGYLRAENPGVLEPPEAGRYDTGDIVQVDDDGYVTIKGRAKRFAKIAGEMVSLSAVEGTASALWPEHMHAVVALPDTRKGERLILVADNKDATRDALVAHAKEQGIAEFMVPKTILILDALPILGTGKIDHVTVKERVKTQEKPLALAG
ncbi:MAG: acyl-[ACP]--phospholipid O-acyltransferase [Rhodospirillales bacterium]|nr:acyl-[ACP]--phospholipid O-acyltransferase [Rhodospirillales bacterium]